VPVAALFPLLLAVLAAAWIVRHVRAWRQAQAEEANAEERRFQQRRFRRRMQGSILLLLVAMGMMAGLMIPPRTYPSLFVYTWFGIVVLVFWIVVLALADALANRAQAERIMRAHRIETARLEAEIARLQRASPNGGPAPPPPKPV
jgi:hypothetical protein